MYVKHATEFVPPGIAARPVFSIASDCFTWADVVRSTEVRGTWQSLIFSVRDGVRADAEARKARAAPSGDEIAEAAKTFRYEHNLIAGDDLLGWLGSWNLSTADWEASLGRAISRARMLSEPGALRHCGLDEDTTAAATWADAVSTGFLGDAAGQFAADMALAAERGRVLGRSTLDFLLARVAADAARAEAVELRALEREVANHRLEWTALRGLMLAFPAADMAKEAAMAVRNDGRTLIAVGRSCGIDAEAFEMLFEDVDGALSPHSLSAREGDLVGPVRLGDAWLLAVIERKTPPSLDDPKVRKRASDRIIRGIEERAISRCVTWHESL